MRRRRRRCMVNVEGGDGDSFMVDGRSVVGINGGGYWRESIG